MFAGCWSQLTDTAAVCLPVLQQCDRWTDRHTLMLYTLVFQPFFTMSPKNFCQEGDVPTIKILLKNTKSMHFYCDFFYGICSSQYEYISLKLNNVTFQSRKIKGF